MTRLPWWAVLPPQVLGYRKDGRPIYAICGGAPEGDDGDGDGSGDSGSGDGGSGDSGAGEAGKDDSADKSGDSGAKDDLEELKRTLRKANERMTAADKRASEAEAKLKKIEEADLSELEKAKGEAEKLQSELDAEREANTKLRIQVAMLEDDSYSWHDRSDVLAALEHDEDVTIDDKGTVVGVKEALKRLATAKPYLVKAPADSGNGTGGASGDAGAGRSGGDTKAKRKDITDKFPALRGRAR